MMHARTLVLAMSLVTSALALGAIGQVVSPAGQLPVAPADDRLAKLPPALREQGRRILAEPDEDRRADLVEELAETDALGALDFLLALLDSDPSADVREDIVDELDGISDPRVDPALERRVLADPDLAIALASLELLRARAEAPLLRLLERRLEDERKTGNAETIGRLVREQERWTTVVRGGLLPTFLQTPPPVFAVAPPHQPVRVLAFGATGTAARRSGSSPR